VPGRSFFALLKGSDAGEGERLLVWAPIGESTAGVVVAASAAVMSEGKYWCYVEKKPGNFVRTELDTSRPVPEGHFVTEGIAPGDKRSAAEFLPVFVPPISAARSSRSVRRCRNPGTSPRPSVRPVRQATPVQTTRASRPRVVSSPEANTPHRSRRRELIV
jgi:hypothetical protein